MQECAVGRRSAKKGSCESQLRLQEHVNEIIHEYVDVQVLVEDIREAAQRLLEKVGCGLRVTSGRRLSLPECIIPSEGVYELKKSCSLKNEIVVENGKTLTIVGIGTHALPHVTFSTRKTCRL